MNGAALSSAFAVLPEYLGQHVLLSVSAIAAWHSDQSAAGHRLGAGSRLLREPVLAFANIVQTIPGLALLALFYPTSACGFRC